MSNQTIINGQDLTKKIVKVEQLNISIDNLYTEEAFIHPTDPLLNRTIYKSSTFATNLQDRLYNLEIQNNTLNVLTFSIIYDNGTLVKEIRPNETYIAYENETYLYSLKSVSLTMIEKDTLDEKGVFLYSEINKYDYNSGSYYDNQSNDYITSFVTPNVLITQRIY